MAGGLLTNTNQNIAFNRNFARDGVIAIDGVYSNPAGVAFLEDGFHLSFNFQNAYQTRTIESGMTIPSMQGTPFYQPFKLNGGNEEGKKTYVGKAAVPILPTFQAAYNKGKWGFHGSFGLYGGGGKASFNEGLGSFERQLALLPLFLYQKNQMLAAAPKDIQDIFDMSTTTPGYSFESYMHGQQYIFGVQLGATYKVNDNFAVYGGLRVNYMYNKYEGSIRNIKANIKGTDTNLADFAKEKYQYASETSDQMATKAAEAQAASQQYAAAGDQEKAAQFAAMAKQAQAGSVLYGTIAQQLMGVIPMVSDKYLNVSQSGWGVTPIIGLDYRWGKLNIGTRLEFTTRLNVQNDVERDDTNTYTKGENTPSDIPGLWTLGLQYEILPNLRAMASYHLYFDKSARMTDNKQEKLSGNTMEYLAGVEWDINDIVTVSAGGQSTRYGLGDGSYLSDMSFVTSSYSLGFGAKVKVAKNMKVNVAYFWTNYEHFNKEYTTQLMGIEVKNTDRFHRTNKVLGVGLDVDF